MHASNLITTVNNLDTANTQGNVELQHNKTVKELAKETVRPLPDESADILLTGICDKEPDALSEELGKHVYVVKKNCSDNANNTPTSLAQIGLHRQSDIQGVETLEKGDNASPIGSALPACLSYQDSEEVAVQITSAKQSSNWELQGSPITIPGRHANIKKQKQGSLSYCTPLVYKPPEADLGKKRAEEHCILASKPEILEDQEKGELVPCQRQSNSLVIAHEVSKSTEHISTKCGGSNGQCEQSLTSERPAPSEAESLECDDNFTYSILLTGWGVVQSQILHTQGKGRQ